MSKVQSWGRSRRQEQEQEAEGRRQKDQYQRTTDYGPETTDTDRHWTLDQGHMIEAIFFDFNGVIIDDEKLQMQVYQQLLGEQGIELSETDYFNSLGMDDETFVREAYKRVNKSLTEELLTKLLDDKGLRHRQLIENELPFFPGVVTFIKALARERDVGLVSMATLREAGYVLERADLTNFFAVVVTADDVGVCKPAPDCYLMGLKRLNALRQEQRRLPVLPSECLVIEDSPPGIESARGAGMRTLGVTNTVPEEPLRQAGAEIVTPSLFDWTPDAIHHLYEG
jgi:beta-phosphoglucomutase